MPIVKQQSSRPLIKDAIVLDLGDLQRQGAKLREAAEAKARQILADARAEADRLVAAAEQIGFDQGHAKGLEAGLAEGREAGHAEALAAGQQTVQQTTEAFMAVAQQWDEHRLQLDREARAGVLRFAMKLARKLTHRTIELNPEVVVDQLRAALSRVLEPTDVIVALNPDDWPTVEAVLPELLSGFGQLQTVKLVNDASLQRGGCVLRLGGGQIDASIDTQCRRICELLMPGDADTFDVDESEAIDDTVAVDEPDTHEPPPSFDAPPDPA